MPPTSYQMPVAQPLGGPTISGTTITVDTLTKPATRIPSIVRDLVANNEGYFAEEIFSTPGFTVEGGAIIYNESFPEDHFLDPNQSIAPRAPGAEAPRIGATRRGPQIARPESWSGSIEVTDEARRRNDVAEVQRLFRLAANTFAERIQSRAIEVLNDFVDANTLTVAGTDWGAAHTSGVVNADPTTLPARDFRTVLTTFVKQKVGIRPDLMIVHPDDAFYLDLIYGDRLPALLGRYGLTMRETILQEQGTALFLKSKQVGVIAFEKPLDQEYSREGQRKTDVYTLEATPVIVANDATAVLRLEGINPTP